MYSKDCFSGVVFFLGLFNCVFCFFRESCFDFFVLCFRCVHFSLFLLSSVSLFVYFLSSLHFHIFSVPGGVLVVPGGSFGRPWHCLGSCRGFLVGPWDILKVAWGLLGGACGIPRSSWSVLGASLGRLGDPWRHLGGPWLLLGSPWATPWGVLRGPRAGRRGS